MLITSINWILHTKNEPNAPQKGLWTSKGGVCHTNRESDPPSLPAALHRRLSPLGKLVMTELYEALSHLPESESTLPWVASCRHGDSTRMMNLLTDLAEKEQLSPMDFSLSVHNAIIGMFSIATKNTQSHTALSGGELSFEMGLLEAYALQKTSQKSVGYIYYDKPLPSLYYKGNHNENLACCIAMILSNKEESNRNGLVLEFVPQQDLEQEENKIDIDQNKGSNKIIRFLGSDQKHLSILSPGGTFLFEKND
jgi:hypothetical protein